MSRKKISKLGGYSPTMPHRRLLLPSVKDKIAKAINKGDVDCFLELTLEGFGDALLGRTCFNEEGRKFLKNLPNLLDNIKVLHTSIINDDLNNVKQILDSEGSLIRAKNENGLMAIHLAITKNRPKIVEYLMNKFPITIHLKDQVNIIMMLTNYYPFFCIFSMEEMDFILQHKIN